MDSMLGPINLHMSEELAKYGLNTRNGTHDDSGNLNCVDLFAGCGGLSLGLEMAGFTPLLFSELNHSAAETYMANRREMDIIPVGDIYNLTDVELKIKQVFWKQRGIEEIDLVCGGPPCQGYSGIGHRRTFDLNKEDIPSNHLFKEMIRVIRCLRPRIFLFENVKGILQGRWTPAGQKGEIFRDVLNGFKELGDYHIKWDLVYAKDYGVPQNRPRVLMVGIRDDVLRDAFQMTLFEDKPFDEPSAVQDGFLPRPNGDSPPSIPDLLSDLEDPEYLRQEKLLATKKYPSAARTPIQRWLRTTRDGKLLGKGSPLREQEYSAHKPYVRDKFAKMIANGGEIPEEYKTKKFAQRVFPQEWNAGGPNITATSLPDDYVHYNQPRTPSVREWARIQTFPDWYEFCGSRTTGGRRRAGDPDAGIWDRDVPRYTQIGNAVPVLLARKIGSHLKANFL
jgi:DNA (cytosine-5)-methyltransferase 1